MPSAFKREDSLKKPSEKGIAFIAFFTKPCF